MIVNWIYCGTMVGIHFCGCGWAPVRGFLWRETHTKGLHVRFPTRLEEDEERQDPRQSTEKGASDSQEKVTDSQREAAAEEGVGTCGPRSQVTQCERMSQHCWEFLSGDMLMIATECWKSVKNFSLLTLRPYSSPFLFVLLSPTLGYTCYVSCIFVKHVKYPGPRWEKPLDYQMAMSWFKKLR